MEVLLRLLRGEDFGEVSREVQVPAPELERWRRVFLEGGVNGLKRRTDIRLKENWIEHARSLGSDDEVGRSLH
jgi:hypothetical protein